MSKTTVKICGLKREDDIRLCMNLGVDILGFVTEYPVPVPWNLSRDEAMPLLGMIRPPYKSCIVTGGSPEKVIELASILCPSLVQLHYKESLHDTIVITEALQKIDIGVIKTIPIHQKDRLCQFGTTSIETIVSELCKTGIYGLLLDSRTPENATENSTQLDLEFCAKIIRSSTKPVILAGGINADNVSSVLLQTGAENIDIMTGVEVRPGEKDAGLLTRLLQSIPGT